MRLTKRGPYWWVDFRDPSGKRRRISTGEAEEAAAYVKAGSIVQGAMLAAATTPSDARPTLAVRLEDTYRGHWSRTRSATVMRRVVDLLKREVADLKLADVNTRGLRALAERWLAAGTAPATVNRRMSAIGVALARAVEDGDLPARPKLPHYAERNKRERYLTAEEEARVLALLCGWSLGTEAMGDDDAAAGWRYVHNLAVFLLDTGFRFSEAYKFRLDGGQADLSHGDTKTGTGRRVPLTPRAAAAAADLLASPIHARLQATESKAAWDWVSHRWQRACAGAGIEGVTLHILRHTCASRLVQRGVPIFTVSKWLGHSSVKVTERYAKLAPNSLSQALAALAGAPVPLEESVHGTQLLPRGQDSTDGGTVTRTAPLRNHS